MELWVGKWTPEELKERERRKAEETKRTDEPVSEVEARKSE